MSRLSKLSPEFKYRLLLEISQKVSRTLDLQEVLSHLLESVCSAVAYDAAGIFVLNRSVPLAHDTWSNLIVGMATVGFPERAPTDDPMLKSARGIVGHVIRTGETVIASDVRLDPRYVQGRGTTLSEIAVPIVSNAQIIGALNLESDRLDAFAAADAELLEFFASAAAISIEKAMLHRQVLEKQRMEQQLMIAREVQSTLLPSAAPAVPGYDIAGINLPTWTISGDYYDYIPLTGGRLSLVIADVSGKGVPAALIMATFRAALRARLYKNGEILGLLEEVNHILLEPSDMLRFVTAFYAVLDPSLGRLDYVDCGHNPPMLLRSSGGQELLDQGGPALGVVGDRQFESGTVSLGPGDVLVLYTDGVVELADSHGTEFGKGRLEQVLRRCARLPAQAMVHSVVEATRTFSGRNEYDDDFTLVIVKRDPTPQY